MVKTNNLISIVIVNWNSGEQLRNCIDSLNRHHENLIDQIVVVDNGSIDGSDMGIEFFSDGKIIHTGTNLGFGKACNLGAQQVESEYLLFLNPDAALYTGSLSIAYEYMRSTAAAKVGICGIQLLDSNGQVSRSCARFPSMPGLVAHALGVDRLFPSLGHHMSEWSHLQTRQVDHVIGAFFFVRRALFNELAGFDERFFVYLEDLDFSYRANQAGWGSIYVAEAQALHVGGGTSNQVKAKRLFYSLRSRLLYVFKHFSWFSAIVVLLVTVLIEPFTRSVLALLRRSWSVFQETCVAYSLLAYWLLKRLGQIILSK